VSTPTPDPATVFQAAQSVQNLFTQMGQQYDVYTNLQNTIAQEQQQSEGIWNDMLNLLPDLTSNVDYLYSVLHPTSDDQSGS
jgi:hypothetical protein